MIVLIFFISFFSFLALCGLLYTNQRSSACPGVPTGYDLLELVYSSAATKQINRTDLGSLISDMHYPWLPVNDSITYWRVKEYHR